MNTRRSPLATAFTFSLLFSALTLSAVTAFAADNSAVLGTWTLTLEIQGRTVEPTLEITEVEGALAGQWTSQRGTDQLSDIKWDGEQLTFVRKLDFNGQEVTLNYTAKVSGNSIEGTMNSPRGETPFKGSRAE